MAEGMQKLRHQTCSIGKAMPPNQFRNTTSKKPVPFTRPSGNETPVQHPADTVSARYSPAPSVASRRNAKERPNHVHRIPAPSTETNNKYRRHGRQHSGSAIEQSCSETCNAAKDPAPAKNFQANRQPFLIGQHYLVVNCNVCTVSGPFR